MDLFLSRWLNFWTAFLVIGTPILYFLHESLTTALIQGGGVLFLALIANSRFLRPGDNSSNWFFRISLLWLGLIGLSVAFSVDPSTSFPVYLKVIGLLAIATGTRFALEDESTATTLYYSAGIASLLHGLMAGVEYLRGDPIPLTWIDPGMRGIIQTRSAGLFGDPNILGAYLTGLFPLNLAGVFQSAPTPPWLFFWGMVFLCNGIGILTTFSRGAFLALGAALFVVILIMKPSWNSSQRKLLLLGVAAILLAIFLIGPFKYRFFSVVQTGDMTFSQRTLINRGLFQALPHVPLTGFGLHTFNQVYPQFRVVGGDYPMNAHNELLQSWIETGPVTVLALLGLLFILGRQVYRLVRGTAGCIPWMDAAFAGVFVAMFVQNLSGFSSRILPTAILIAIGTGGLLRPMKLESIPATFWFQRLLPRPAWIIPLILFLAFTVANLHTQHLLIEAQNSLAGRQFMFAENALESIERLHSRIPLLHFLRAKLDEIQGHPASAEARLERAIELNPTEAAFWEYKAALKAKAGTPDSLAALERALALDPASELYRLQYAQKLASAGRPLEALQQCDVGLKYSPGFHDVYQGFQRLEEFRRTLLPLVPAVPASGSLDPPPVATP
jgi:O-antigen ligase